jgi:hypothetical protein
MIRQSKNYYVYALIDPRNNEIFYIGKGKGGRYKSHLKETLKNHTNYAKFKRIREIYERGYKVETEILFPYLEKETSYQLEKIIIYKLGREKLLEGSLTNVIPGGRWKLGDSILYNDNIDLEFDISKLDFISKERFLAFEKKSTFNYLNIKNIFKYDYRGKLISIDSLDCFFEEFNSFHFDIFQSLVLEDLPVFGKEFVFSKSLLNDIYFSENIPFPLNHIFNSEFCKEFDKSLNEKDSFVLKYDKDNIIRLKVKFKDSIVSLTSYFKNGNYKFFRQSKNNSNFGKSIDWDEKGNIKTEMEYNNNSRLISNKEYYEGKLVSEYYIDNEGGKKTIYYYKNGSIKEEIYSLVFLRRTSRTLFYENGLKNISYNNFKENLYFQKWDKDGEIEEEYKNGVGYIFYHKTGKKIYSQKQSNFIDETELFLTESYRNITIQLDVQKDDKDWELF